MNLIVSEITYRIPLNEKQWEALTVLDFKVLTDKLSEHIDTGTIEYGDFAMHNFYFTSAPEDAETVLRIFTDLIEGVSST
jgi:hypothetical protein